MKAVRILAAIATAATVLVGGAWAGGALAERRAPERATYPGSRDVVRIGQDLAVAGQPMQLSLFRTADPPIRIARFYADAFRARGLTPVMSSEANLAHVAAFDPGDGLQRFITAIRPHDGDTLVMVGSANPRTPPRFLEGEDEVAGRQGSAVAPAQARLETEGIRPSVCRDADVFG